MKKLKFIKAMKLHLLILLLLCFSACSEDENGDIALALDKTSLTLKKGEDTQAVLISGSTVWEASVPEEDSWCSVMRMNDTKLVIMAKANEGPDYRHTTVTVTSGSQSLTIAVQQIGEITYMLDKPEELLFNAAGDSLKIILSANCNWEYTIDDNWCHAGKEADTLWIFADTTSLTDYRTTNIHLTLNGKEDYLSFEANQLPYIDPELSIDPAHGSMLIVNQNETVNIKVASRLPWTYRLECFYPAGIVELIDCQVTDDGILKLNIPEDIPDFTMVYVYISSGDMDYAKQYYLTLAIGFPS